MSGAVEHVASSRMRRAICNLQSTMSEPREPSGATGAVPHPELGPNERARLRERVVDVLWRHQEQRGWIDDDAVRETARECALSPSEVDELATFYNLLHRRPAGRTTVYVCDSISCELNGASQLMAALADALDVAPGGVTADGEIGLLPIVCLGHCERAPCLLAGRTIHGPCATDAAGVRTLIEAIRRG
jgi:NADH-quinone oxidoreductase subunit E